MYTVGAVPSIAVARQLSAPSIEIHYLGQPFLVVRRNLDDTYNIVQGHLLGSETTVIR